MQLGKHLWHCHTPTRGAGQNQAFSNFGYGTCLICQDTISSQAAKVLSKHFKIAYLFKKNKKKPHQTKTQQEQQQQNQQEKYWFAVSTLKNFPDTPRWDINEIDQKSLNPQCPSLPWLATIARAFPLPCAAISLQNRPPCRYPPLLKQEQTLG